jgi:rubrerythrin
VSQSTSTIAFSTLPRQRLKSRLKVVMNIECQDGEDDRLARVAPNRSALRAQVPGKRKEKAMQFEHLEAILDFAIEKEIEAADFYTNLSKETTFSGSAKMFAEFATEERKHQKMLEDFKSQGFATAVAGYKFEWITDIKRSDYVVELEYTPGLGYNEILILAMKREEAALKLYNEFLIQADSAEGKNLFKVLCQEEAKHKLALETMYDDYMAKMGD